MNSDISFPRRVLFCVGGALLVVLSFPNFFDKTLTPWTAFLGWVALIPLFRALKGMRPGTGGFLGFVFGFTQFGGILYWIAFLEEAKYLSGLAWFILVSYLSFYYFLFGWIYCWLAGRLKRKEVWVAPFLWVALEYFRGSRPWGGFNWGELGYSQAPYPSILIFTSLAGVYGLTFLMVWFNARLAQGLESPAPPSVATASLQNPKSRWVYLLIPFSVLFLVVMAGKWIIHSTSLQKAGTVALLQPSIDQTVKWNKGYERDTYDRLGRLVKETQSGHPDLIVWPETAAPSYLLLSPQALGRVISIVRRSGVPNLVGCLDAVRGPNKLVQYFNAAVHFGSNGKPVGAYHKRHLVPFGEFVPFQKYISFLGPVVGDLGNFDTGTEYKKFQAREFSFTPMICYEVVFPGDVRAAFQTGADALVNISNDAWYGRTASAYQHVMMAVVRTAEERKPLLRSANTGICLVADPFGRIQVSTRLFEVTTVTADVLTSRSGPTLYSRFGNWLPRLCWIVVGLFVMLAFRKPAAENPKVA